jgi:hypothetical protein
MVDTKKTKALHRLQDSRSLRGRYLTAECSLIKCWAGIKRLILHHRIVLFYHGSTNFCVAAILAMPVGFGT